MDKKSVDSVSPSRKRGSAHSKCEDLDARSHLSGRSGASGKSGGSSKHSKSPAKGHHNHGSKGHSEGGKRYDREERKLTPEMSLKCYGLDFKMEAQECHKPTFNWQEGKYVRDECGSGMVPYQRKFRTGRIVWCRTPLTMYQATHGELGRQVLCRETNILRDIRPAPPCNVCHSILPPCKGYYRRYECIRPCEEKFATKDKHGNKDYRDAVKRYWDPCVNQTDQAAAVDVNSFAHHNVALGMKMKRQLEDQPCW